MICECAGMRGLARIETWACGHTLESGSKFTVQCSLFIEGTLHLLISRKCKVPSMNNEH